MMEWLLYGLLYGLLTLLTGLALVLLSPRFKGGKDAPPLVTSSPVVPIPLIGVIAEFFKSPNTMIKRCHRDYGPVFTIPVRLFGGVCLVCGSWRRAHTLVPPLTQ
jgi:hypothetical protein